MAVVTAPSTPTMTPAPVMPFPWPQVASEPLAVLAAFSGKDQGVDVVVLYLSETAMASVYYTVAVKGMSAAIAQSSVPISARGEIETGEFDAKLEEQNVAVPNYPLFGVASGMNPLNLIPRPAFTKVGDAAVLSNSTAKSDARQDDVIQECVFAIHLWGVNARQMRRESCLALTSCGCCMAAATLATVGGD
eukprot:2308222-Rhodomonas_salina.1